LSRVAARPARLVAVCALSVAVAVPGALVGAGCGPKENARAPGAGTGAGAAKNNTGEIVVDGYRVILAQPSKRGPTPSKAGDAARARALANLVRTPTSPDPEAGDFTLEEAVAGLGTDGTLVAEIGTDLGTMECDLYADKTPKTVANFIGLARGLRPWWDARAGAWVTRPMYRGTNFHRVIPNYMIQGGDYLGDGSGTVGYTIPDELRSDLPHDRTGLLCMANTAPNQNGAQFFLLDGAAPQLDALRTYTVFGRCLQADVVSRIARVPQDGTDENRPLTPVGIVRVVVRRIVGGAANAVETRPAAPAGEQRPTGASPPPGSSGHVH
jgi:peptidyl-prolyl cis-trans isomerase A (cyclophilin A)